MSSYDCLAYRAKHAYTATVDGDVSFREGDIIVVVETLENGWWRGVVDGQSGWFPASYVDVIPQTPAAATAQEKAGFQWPQQPTGGA